MEYQAQSVLTAVLNVGSTYEAVNLAWPWYYWVGVKEGETFNNMSMDLWLTN